MARTKDKEKVIALRKQGMSYSQIKKQTGVSKSTLSNWLHDMPLTSERIKELRDFSEVRIEKTREAKRKKKESRRKEVFDDVSKHIKNSRDPFFVAGFYLYWGEGTKTAEYSVSFTNSDPSMVRCFVKWLKLLDINEEKLKAKLHLYSDQDEHELTKFWSNVSGIPTTRFNKTYRKKSMSHRKTYKGMFPYGTCVVMYHNRDIYEYVLEGIKYLRKKHSIAA